MAEIVSKNSDLKSLSGIHLWHADMSSCSQRVRLALAEKNLDYTSHLINLQTGENASEAYQMIHPQGLVPAMVIDGALFIESIDIIDEIDRRFLEPRLRPADVDGVRSMETFMQRANDTHPALKLLTFEFLFSATFPPPREALEAFQKTHKNEYLKKFHLDFRQGFSRERVSEAVIRSHKDFCLLETAMTDGRHFLAGDCFSLADIAWMPNLHRFSLFGWPLDTYPNLNAWFERVRQRPSYKKGLMDWEPKPFIDAVSPKIRARKDAGEGVGAYLRSFR